MQHTNTCLASLASGVLILTGSRQSPGQPNVREGEDCRPDGKSLARRQADGWRALLVPLPQCAPGATGTCQRAAVCKPRGGETFWPEYLGRLPGGGHKTRCASRCCGGVTENCFHFEAVTSDTEAWALTVTPAWWPCFFFNLCTPQEEELVPPSSHLCSSSSSHVYK